MNVRFSPLSTPTCSCIWALVLLSPSLPLSGNIIMSFVSSHFHAVRTSIADEYTQHSAVSYWDSISMIHHHPGITQLVPGRTPFGALCSPSLTVTPVLSPGTPKAAVYGRHGSVLGAREVGWRSGEPVPRKAY